MHPMALENYQKHSTGTRKKLFIAFVRFTWNSKGLKAEPCDTPVLYEIAKNLVSVSEISCYLG